MAGAVVIGGIVAWPAAAVGQRRLGIGAVGVTTRSGHGATVQIGLAATCGPIHADHGQNPATCRSTQNLTVGVDVDLGHLGINGDIAATGPAPFPTCECSDPCALTCTFLSANEQPTIILRIVVQLIRIGLSAGKACLQICRRRSQRVCASGFALRCQSAPVRKARHRGHGRWPRAFRP